MENPFYNVFLSFNSEDRDAVEKIAIYLNDKANLRPWFDQWELTPGEPWVRNLERGLTASATCAVFVGKSGEGPWQQREVETALRQQVNNSDFRVIPVLLPDAPKQPELPMFLAGNMWVDFRGKGLDDDDTLWRLECGILGRPPGRGRSSQPETQEPIPPFVNRDQRGFSQEIPNPFGDTGRLENPRRFFDREELLRQIFEELDKGSNLSLVGESQIGKSSLLGMICALGPEEMQHPPDAFAYMTMEWVDDEDDFYETLCEELHIESCRGGKLRRALKGKRYLLCLDEIEKMTWDGFTERVRSHLRGLADGKSAPLRLVIASRSALDNLFPDSPEMTSPLAGICHKLDVKPFSPDVVRDFLKQRLNGTGISFTEQQMHDVITKTAGHPAKLQSEAAALYRELRKRIEHG